MIVVDASVVFDFLIRTTDSARIESRFVDAEFRLHAPELLPIEVISALGRQQRRRGVLPKDEELVDDLHVLPVTLHPHLLFARRVWQLRHNFSAYDALYVALAEYLNAPLLTRDRRLAAPSKAHKARIEVI